jgi:hypothetical protein
MSVPNLKAFDADRVVARRWLWFGIGVGVTALLVLAAASPPMRNLFRRGDAQPRSATRLSLPGDDHRPPSTASPAPSKSATPSPTSTLAPATTTEAPTTTTVALQKPGLRLLAQPVPTPVPLPATSLAPVFSRIPTPNKVIFLGIDDGIVRDPAVLDLLKQADIPFTMFLVQAQAHTGADYWKQAQALGGIVEAHTITHPDLTKVSTSQMQHEICGTLSDDRERERDDSRRSDAGASLPQRPSSTPSVHRR